IEHEDIGTQVPGEQKVLVVGRDCESARRAARMWDLGGLFAARGIEEMEMIARVQHKGLSIAGKHTFPESAETLDSVCLLIWDLHAAGAKGVLENGFAGLRVPSAQIKIIAPGQQSPAVGHE